jgi:hypothetical protein
MIFQTSETAHIPVTLLPHLSISSSGKEGEENNFSMLMS